MAWGDGGVFVAVLLVILHHTPSVRAANMCPYATPDHNGHTCYDQPTAAVQNCGVLVDNSLCNGCDSGNYFGAMAGGACCLSCGCCSNAPPAPPGLPPAAPSVPPQPAAPPPSAPTDVSDCFDAVPGQNWYLPSNSGAQTSDGSVTWICRNNDADAARLVCTHVTTCHDFHLVALSRLHRAQPRASLREDGSTCIAPGTWRILRAIGLAVGRWVGSWQWQ